MAKAAKDVLDGKSEALRKALEAVERMDREEAVLVPAAPSARMLRAGARIGEVDEDTAGRIYRAMILAAR
ncbi:MAG: hypothetical protein ACE5GS_15275 [Kiloniellaceae bacterium]